MLYTAETLLNRLIVFVVKRGCLSFFFVCKNYVNAKNNLFELLFDRLEEPIIIKFGFFEVVSLLRDLINN